MRMVILGVCMGAKVPTRKVIIRLSPDANLPMQPLDEIDRIWPRAMTGLDVDVPGMASINEVGSPRISPCCGISERHPAIVPARH